MCLNRGDLDLKFKAIEEMLSLFCTLKKAILVLISHVS
jgi:hypothetical protein